MTLDRDTRRLLAELAFASAHQCLRKEARVFLDALGLLIEDPEDREASRAYLHVQLGELDQAAASLGGCRADAARTLSQLIARHRGTARLARPMR